jgi:hypothetical protein
MEIKITVREYFYGDSTIARDQRGKRFYDKYGTPSIEDEVLDDIMDYAEKRIGEARPTGKDE